MVSSASHHQILNLPTSAPIMPSAFSLGVMFDMSPFPIKIQPFHLYPAPHQLLPMQKYFPSNSHLYYIIDFSYTRSVLPGNKYASVSTILKYDNILFWSFISL